MREKLSTQAIYLRVIGCKLVFIMLTASLILGNSALAGENPTIEQLINRFGLEQSTQPSKAHKLYKKPEKVVVWNRVQLVNALTKRYPEINFVPVSSLAEIEEHLVDADVYIGYCVSPLRDLQTSLRFIQSLAVGVERCANSDILKRQGVLVSNIQKMSGPEIAEHAIALMMSLVRGLDQYQKAQADSQWDRSIMSSDNAIWEIEGRTMLVVGLGGIGREVARRAHGLGMTVVATRNSSREGPEYVEYVGLSNEVTELAKRADVVVNTLPLTNKTRGIINRGVFAAMPSHAYYISVGRGATTDTEAMVDALQTGTIAGAGLDVTEPEPLPKEHPLWTMPRVLITPHMAARSDKYQQRVLTLALANFDRYMQGLPILNEVDLERGY